jgi:hypothetical protein
MSDKEIIKELALAYRMLSGMCVSGDNVDILAAARSSLRKVCEALTVEQQKGADTNG